MKRMIATLAFGALCVASTAQGGRLEDDPLLGNNPVLTPQEEAAIAIAREADDEASSAIVPQAGANGEIRFVYGDTRPSLVCSPLNVCDISLQRGEHDVRYQIGDSKRWVLTPERVGQGADEVVHVFIKPTSAGLETNLVITTERRIYHLRLRSHRTEYMPLVSFVYPEDAQAKFDALRVRQAQERADKTIPETGDNLADVYWDYDVQGAARWKPIRVYSNSKQTIVQMPRNVAADKLPVLYILKREAGLFSDEKLEIVSQRFKDGRFIVDAVLEKAILIKGTGDQSERVTIIRGGE